jgi:hypothetical protein
MEREQVLALIKETLAPVSARFDAYLETEKEGRRVINSLLARLTAVVAGDKEFNQPGLTDKVANHEKEIAAFRTIQTETKGMVRGIVVLGGLFFTLVNLALQVYFASRGH